MFGVYILPHTQGFFKPSEPLIRDREIVLREEDMFFRSANAPLHRLFITDLLGDVFTGDGPRCWPEFGRRWMAENNFEHVRRQTGDPCGNHYPFLFLRRKC